MKLLKDKVALITGASRGIGKAIALQFAKEGANIAFTDLLYDDIAKATEKDLVKTGVKAKAYASNASKFGDTDKVITAILKDFDGIDILVNNAGITRDNLLLRMSEEQWDEVITTNLKSVFNFTKHILPLMLKQKGGSIINIASIVGITGNAGQSNYSSSKAGIIGFTKSMSKELGSRNIRCNAIAPGFIATDMTKKLDESIQQKFIEQIPLKRYGSPEEVAGTALFLASDLGSYINGQVLSVCGGLYS